MLRFDSTAAQIVAVLHDVVEGSEISFELLRQLGFSHEIIEAVDSLTRQQGESYEDFIDRIAANPLATRIKLHDLRDNMDVSRLKHLDEAAVSRVPARP